MVIELSLLKNNIKEKLSIVILCAGEGTRLKKITQTTPKPLIKIKSLDNFTILHHLINNLIKLEIKHIAIVIGYLGESINEFILNLKKKNPIFQERLIIIDTENEYKLGPLYSFLSITKDNSFFTKKNCYLVIPGDTIFDFYLLKEILAKISKDYDLFHNNPSVFYRNIRSKLLKVIYKQKRLISNAEISKKGSEITLNRISQLKVRDLLNRDELNQIIPIIALNYESIIEILNLNKKNPFKTVWEALNYMIINRKKIIACKIESKNSFYDIDYSHDLKKFKKKKKRTIGAPIIIDSKALKKNNPMKQL